MDKDVSNPRRFASRNWDDLSRRLGYIKPNDEQVKRMRILRAVIDEMGGDINALVPEGFEKEQALLKLQEVIMWCNAGIAWGGEKNG